MTGRYSLAICLLLAAGCAPREAEERTSEPSAATSPATSAATGPASPSPTSEPLAKALPAEELPGEYRVAGVDGGDIDLPHAITASIADRRIRIVSGCVEAAWRYTYQRGRLTTAREPVVSCDRGRYPEEEAVFAAFDAAERVARTLANGIALTGGGHSVTLFSQ